MTTNHEHAAALRRAGNVFLWAISTGPLHSNASPESATEQIVAMYLREVRDRDGCEQAATILELYFPENRR